jgi:hypothetical protein
MQAIRLHADVHIACLQPQPKPALADDTFHFAFLDSEVRTCKAFVLLNWLTFVMQAPLSITMYALGDRVTVAMGCSAHYREILQPFFKKMQSSLL